MSNENLRYKEYRQGRRFLVKIRPGESLQGSICALLAAEKIESAVVLSGIGSVRNVRLKDIKSGAKLPITPARLVEHEMEGPFELLCITGNIVPCVGRGDRAGVGAARYVHAGHLTRGPGNPLRCRQRAPGEAGCRHLRQRGDPVPG